MVPVQMGDQDGHIPPQADRLRDYPTLDAFPAVHQDYFPFAPERDCWETSVLGGCRRAGPEERDGEFDRPYLLLRTVIVLVRSL